MNSREKQVLTNTVEVLESDMPRFTNQNAGHIHVCAFETKTSLNSKLEARNAGLTSSVHVTWHVYRMQEAGCARLGT